MSSNTDKLKKCPFCGEPGKVARVPGEVSNNLYVVGCDGKSGCLCPGYVFKCRPVYFTKQLAIEYWNHRKKA